MNLFVNKRTMKAVFPTDECPTTTTFDFDRRKSSKDSETPVERSNEKLSLREPLVMLRSIGILTERRRRCCCTIEPMLSSLSSLSLERISGSLTYN